MPYAPSVVAIPETQLAAVLHDDYGARYSIERSWLVKQPDADEVLVRLEASGICFGDIHAREGGLPAPSPAVRPLVGGHEGIGRLVALGTGTEERGFRVGDHVGLGWRKWTCRECVFCSDGQDNHCPRQVASGFDADGTLQQYVRVPAHALARIPETNVPAAELAPILCGGATALAAVRRTQAPKGTWLAVPGGGGGVGHLVLQYAKHAGLKTLAIDRRSKEKFCRECGADAFASFEDEDMVGDILKITGGVQSTVVVSAISSAYFQALAYSAPNAIIVGVGPVMASVHTGMLMEKNITLVGQRNGTKKDIEDALALVNEGVKPVVELVKIEQVDEALDRLQKGDVSGRLAVILT